MATKTRKGDLVEVVCDRSSDKKKLAEHSARHATEGLRPLRPGDRGKQGRVIKVFPVEGTVLVEGVSPKTRHVRQDQNRAGGIETAEVPILLAKVTFIDPGIRQCVCVDFREDAVRHDGRTRKIRVRVTRGGVAHNIE